MKELTLLQNSSWRLWILDTGIKHLSLQMLVCYKDRWQHFGYVGDKWGTEGRLMVTS